jgi:hypothetical protein
MTEKRLEMKLREAVRRRGGLALKFVSPGNAGVPDRLILWPGGRLVFVELKAGGRKPTPLQCACFARLRGLGFTVVVVDSPEALSAFLRTSAPATVPGVPAVPDVPSYPERKPSCP